MRPRLLIQTYLHTENIWTKSVSFIQYKILAQSRFNGFRNDLGFTSVLGSYLAEI